jgi:hypothetical protein
MQYFAAKLFVMNILQTIITRKMFQTQNLARATPGGGGTPGMSSQIESENEETRELESSEIEAYVFEGTQCKAFARTTDGTPEKPRNP